MHHYVHTRYDTYMSLLDIAQDIADTTKELSYKIGDAKEQEKIGAVDLRLSELLDIRVREKKYARELRYAAIYGLFEHIIEYLYVIRTLLLCTQRIHNRHYKMLYNDFMTLLATYVPENGKRLECKYSVKIPYVLISPTTVNTLMRLCRHNIKVLSKQVEDFLNTELKVRYSLQNKDTDKGKGIYEYSIYWDEHIGNTELYRRVVDRWNNEHIGDKNKGHVCTACKPPLRGTVTADEVYGYMYTNSLELMHFIKDNNWVNLMKYSGYRKVFS